MSQASCSIALLCEHHLPPEGLRAVKKRLRKIGWCGVWGAASCSFQGRRSSSLGFTIYTPARKLASLSVPVGLPRSAGWPGNKTSKSRTTSRQPALSARRAMSMPSTSKRCCAQIRKSSRHLSRLLGGQGLIDPTLAPAGGRWRSCTRRPLPLLAKILLQLRSRSLLRAQRFRAMTRLSPLALRISRRALRHFLLLALCPRQRLRHKTPVDPRQLPLQASEQWRAGKALLRKACRLSLLRAMMLKPSIRATALGARGSLPALSPPGLAQPSSEHFSTTACPEIVVDTGIPAEVDLNDANDATARAPQRQK